MNEQEILARIPKRSTVPGSLKPDDQTRYLFAPLERVIFDGVAGGGIPAGIVYPVFTEERKYNAIELEPRKMDTAIHWQTEEDSKNGAKTRYGYIKEYPGPIVKEILLTAANKGLIEVDAFDGMDEATFVTQGLYRLLTFNTNEQGIVTKAQYEQRIASLMDYEGFGAENVRKALPQLLAAVERAAQWCIRHLEQRAWEIEQAKGGKTEFNGYHNNQDVRAMHFLGLSVQSLIQKQVQAEQVSQVPPNVTLNIGPEFAAAIREAIGQQPAPPAAETPTPEAGPTPAQLKLQKLAAEVKAESRKADQKVRAAQGGNTRAVGISAGVQTTPVAAGE